MKSMQQSFMAKEKEKNMSYLRENWSLYVKALLLKNGEVVKFK
jgi:hypothetical protein